MKQNHIKELKKGKIKMKKVKVILVKNNKETFEKANQQYIYYALLIKE